MPLGILGAARHLLKIDIDDDASLSLDYLVENRRIEFQDATLAGVPGRGMGGLFFDHSLAGYLRISPGGAMGDAGTTFDSVFSLTDGRLKGDFDRSTRLDIAGGGRDGEGFRLDNETIILSANFLYIDDGNALGFRDITGRYDINNLRVDVTQDWQGRKALGLTLGSLEGELAIGSIDIGGSGNSFGRVNLDFLFRNGRAAIIAGPYDEGGGEQPQKGLCLTELDYDAHVRDMTVDVTEEGLAIIKGEAWSTPMWGISVLATKLIATALAAL